MVEETRIDTRPGKLSEELQDQVCRKLAAFIGPTSICQWLESEHGITIGKPTILHYRDSKAWSDKHARYRAEWQSGTKDLYPLANVTGRIKELEGLYADALKEYKLASGADKRALRNQCQSILEQIQTEIPGADVAGSGPSVTIELPDYMREGLHLEPAGKGD